MRALVSLSAISREREQRRDDGRRIHAVPERVPPDPRRHPQQARPRCPLPSRRGAQGRPPPPQHGARRGRRDCRPTRARGQGQGQAHGPGARLQAGSKGLEVADHLALGRLGPRPPPLVPPGTLVLPGRRRLGRRRRHFRPLALGRPALAPPPIDADALVVVEPARQRAPPRGRERRDRPGRPQQPRRPAHAAHQRQRAPRGGRPKHRPREGYHRPHDPPRIPATDRHRPLHRRPCRAHWPHPVEQIPMSLLHMFTRLQVFGVVALLPVQSPSVPSSVQCLLLLSRISPTFALAEGETTWIQHAREECTG